MGFEDDGYRLVRFQDAHNRRHWLTKDQWYHLDIIARRGGLRPAQGSARAALPVRLLEERGLIIVRRKPHSSEWTVTGLTDFGRAVYEASVTADLPRGHIVGRRPEE